MRHLSLFVFLPCFLAYGNSVEIFHEDVFFKSNRDGTVTSTFSFTTLLRGQQPRDPTVLREEDTREQVLGLVQSVAHGDGRQRSTIRSYRSH